MEQNSGDSGDGDPAKRLRFDSPSLGQAGSSTVPLYSPSGWDPQLYQMFQNPFGFSNYATPTTTAQSNTPPPVTTSVAVAATTPAVTAVTAVTSVATASHPALVTTSGFHPFLPTWPIASAQQAAPVPVASLPSAASAAHSGMTFPYPPVPYPGMPSAPTATLPPGVPPPPVSAPFPAAPFAAPAMSAAVAAVPPGAWPPFNNTAFYNGLLHHANASLAATAPPMVPGPHHSGPRPGQKEHHGRQTQPPGNSRVPPPFPADADKRGDSSTHHLASLVEEAGCLVTKGRAPKTWQEHDRYVNAFRDFLSFHNLPQEFTLQHTRLAIAEWHRQGISSNVIHRRVSAIKRHLELEGITAPLPEKVLQLQLDGVARERRVTRPGEFQPTRKHPVTLPQLRDVMSTAFRVFTPLEAPIFAAIAALAFHCLLRPNELLFDSRADSLGHTMLRDNVKLLPTGVQLTFLTHKTLHPGQDPVVKLFPWPRDLNLQAVLYQYFKVAPPAKTFFAVGSYQPVPYEWFASRLAIIVKNLALPSNFTPHSFRAGGAMHLIQQGATLTEVQDRGRWATVANMMPYLSEMPNKAPLLSIQSSLDTASHLLPGISSAPVFRDSKSALRILSGNQVPATRVGPGSAQPRHTVSNILQPLSKAPANKPLQRAKSSAPSKVPAAPASVLDLEPPPPPPLPTTPALPRTIKPFSVPDGPGPHSFCIPGTEIQVLVTPDVSKSSPPTPTAAQKLKATIKKQKSKRAARRPAPEQEADADVDVSSVSITPPSSPTKKPNPRGNLSRQAQAARYKRFINTVRANNKKVKFEARGPPAIRKRRKPAQPLAAVFVPDAVPEVPGAAAAASVETTEQPNQAPVPAAAQQAVAPPAASPAIQEVIKFPLAFPSAMVNAPCVSLDLDYAAWVAALELVLPAVPPGRYPCIHAADIPEQKEPGQQAKVRTWFKAINPDNSCLWVLLPNKRSARNKKNHFIFRPSHEPPNNKLDDLANWPSPVFITPCVNISAKFLSGILKGQAIYPSFIFYAMSLSVEPGVFFESLRRLILAGLVTGPSRTGQPLLFDMMHGCKAAPSS